MSQDTRDYYAGRDAFEAGQPRDPLASEAWHEGWDEALFEDAEGLN